MNNSKITDYFVVKNNFNIMEKDNSPSRILHRQLVNDKDIFDNHLVVHDKGLWKFKKKRI